MSHWNDKLESRAIIINKINDKEVNIPTKIQAHCTGWSIKIIDVPNQDAVAKEILDIILTEEHLEEGNPHNSWNIVINGMRFDCRSFSGVCSRYILLSLHCTFLFGKTDEYKEFADLGLSCGCNYTPEDIREKLLKKEEENKSEEDCMIGGDDVIVSVKPPAKRFTISQSKRM
jgi:hypothetical protein